MKERPRQKRVRPIEPVAVAEEAASASIGAVAAEDVTEILDEGQTSSRVDLGLVRMDVPAGWRFYPLDDRIIGRPGSNVGGMQIAVVSRRELPKGPSHEMLMSAARAKCSYATYGPGSDPAKEKPDGSPAGGESFHSGRDFVRIWYHLQPQGLVVAWFACKYKRMIERSVKQLVHQCDKIVASIRLPSKSDA